MHDAPIDSSITDTVFAPVQPHDTRLSYAVPGDPFLKRAAIATVEVLSGRRSLERRYRELRRTLHDPGDFWGEALARLRVGLDYDAARLSAVPGEGPIVFVANHPLGVIDGLALCALGRQARPRYQILINSALCTDPLLTPFLLPVDFGATREAIRTTIATKKSALRALQAGGALLVFPAGGIATADGWRGPVVDLAWKRFTARLIQESAATVVPIFFHGRNGALFQIASQFSPSLRLALIMHEVRRHEGRTLRIEIGAPIPYSDIAHLTDRQALLDHLRCATMALGGITGPAALRAIDL